MIIFLYGSDSYRLKAGRSKIIEEYNKKHSSGVNLFYYDFLEPSDPTRLEDILKNTSFFDEHRLAVVGNVFAKKQSMEKVIAIINDYDLQTIKDTTFLFSEPTSEKELEAKNKSLFKLLSNSGNIVKSFEPLQGQEISSWIKGELKERRCTIRPEALKYLIQATGGDSWKIIAELNKLSSYKKSGEIDQKDIDQLMSSAEDLNIFDLTDAIGSKNKIKSAELIYRNLAMGRDPYHLLFLITNHFRNLLMVKSLNESGTESFAIAKKTGLHPFVVKKAQSQISKFSAEDLRTRYKHLSEIDAQSKEGKSSIEDNLYKFVFNY